MAISTPAPEPVVVTVMTVVPEATPVTTPWASTAAMVGALELNVELTVVVPLARVRAGTRVTVRPITRLLLTGLTVGLAMAENAVIATLATTCCPLGDPCGDDGATGTDARPPTAGGTAHRNDRDGAVLSQLASVRMCCPPEMLTVSSANLATASDTAANAMLRISGGAY